MEIDYNGTCMRVLRMFVRGMKISFPKVRLVFITYLALGVLPASAQETPCAFDDAALSYVGSPRDQARCLLRPVLIGGRLGATLRKLPEPFDKLIGKPIDVDRAALQRYFLEHNISEIDVGGS